MLNRIKDVTNIQYRRLWRPVTDARLVAALLAEEQTGLPLPGPTWL